MFSTLRVDLEKFILVAVLFHLQKFTIWMTAVILDNALRALLFTVEIILQIFTNNECYKKL